jgi:polysaccharide biosynthesis/export protein
MYQISNGMRLTDLYARAGGSSIRYYDGQVLDAAELKLSLFIRDGKIISLDFRRAIEKGDPIHNIPIRKGDYVYIAVRSESMVCLIGDVITPHKRLWDNNLGLLQLLTTGGFVKETYWPYVIIIRGGVANPTLYKVDLDAILQGRAPNVMLEPGDVVYVPKDDVSEFNVFVRKIMPSFTLFNSIRGVRN